MVQCVIDWLFCWPRLSFAVFLPVGQERPTINGYTKVNH
jgi:hypothetical protein